MVLPALILAVLAQSGASPADAKSRELAVLVSRRVSVPDARGLAVAKKVVDFLKEQNFNGVRSPGDAAKSLSTLGVKDSADCDGKPECISGLGRVLRVWGVVGIDLADIDGTMAIHIEAVESDRGDKLAALDIVLPSRKVDTDLAGELVPLGSLLREALENANYQLKPLPDDAPKQANLTPTPNPNPTPAVQSAPMSGKTVAVVLTGGAAAVAAAVAIVFLAQAASTQGELNAAKIERAGGVAYDMSEERARALAAKANGNYSAALGTGLGAGVLAVLTGVLWAIP